MNTHNAKVAVSIVLVLLGASLAVVMTSGTSAQSTEGVVVDFGDRDITYTDVPDKDSDAVSALRYACSYNDYDLEFDGWNVISVNSVPSSGSTDVWGLYVTYKGSTEWTAVTGDPESIILSDYSVVAWALCAPGDKPTPGVDATGICYYQYPTANRVISLAPSCTETVCAVGAFNSLVGTDMYSNYPAAVVEGQRNGTIALVGGYTNPSYEMVIQQDPDIVIGISSQTGHAVIAEKLRDVGRNVLVTYDGEDMRTVLDNTYMVGVAMGYDMSAKKVVSDIKAGLQAVYEALPDYRVKPSVIVSLSSDKSPWVSGSDTYMADILNFTYCDNSYSSESGWVLVNSETIAKLDPDCIIFIGCGYGGYREMLDSLSAEWKSTKAYQYGNVFVLDGTAVDLASRPSVRLAQITELVARIMHPDAFDTDIPYYIGDDYEDYLTYTKDLGFNRGIQ